MRLRMVNPKKKKIGRNDPCPCGSGVKTKYCDCKSKPNPQNYKLEMIDTDNNPAAKAFMNKMIEEQEKKAQIFKEKYGDVRPIISADHKNQKFVNVGRQIRYLDNCETLHDFFCSYMKDCLGQEWGAAELKKEFSERHIIIQWAGQLLERVRKDCIPGRKIQNTPMTGLAMAYLSLAYDLFVLRNNYNLQKTIVQRLKNKDQFQGARYELYVTASFLKAGFDINFENETDGTTTHVEFEAIHKETKKLYSVEAKSRHRKGVIGRSGNCNDFKKLTLRIGNLLNKALKKDAKHKRIIFIDLNMPPHQLSKPNWHIEICKAISKIQKKGIDGSPTPSAFLFFTNHPNHYIGERGTAQKPNFFLSATNDPKFNLENNTIPPDFSLDQEIRQIWNSLHKHGKIPEFFNDEHPIISGSSPY